MLKRRDLLIASAASLGGIAIGYRQLKQKPGNPLAANLEEGLTALTPYVIIDQTGVTLIAPRAEMGQGIHTTLAALIAEELDIQLDSVKVVHGPASETYSNTVLFKPATPKGLVDGFLNKLRHDAGPPRATQLTGGQTSIQDGFIKMRKAGAAARTVLLQAAAKKLETDVSLLRAENGAIVDGRGARIPYADLAIAARDFDPPQNPPLKPRQQWRILGVSQPRVDMEYKCTGRARYSA